MKHYIHVSQHFSGWGWYCECGAGNAYAHCKSDNAAFAAGNTHLRGVEDRARRAKEQVS